MATARVQGGLTMTNREWLSSQDDETIADFIAEGEAYARVLSVTNDADGTIIVKENITKWLKAEHKEGESND
jgi:hypothetical protein